MITRLYLFTAIIILSFSTQSLRAQKDGAIVNKFHSEYSINNKKLVKRIELSIIVFNRDGEDLTKFYVPYSNDIRVANLKATVETLFGKKIKELQRKDIETYSAVSNFSLYEDDFVKKFVLRHNEYPYVVKCSYELHFNNFMRITEWSPVYHVDYKTTRATLQVNIPANYPVKINEKRIETDTIEHYESGIIYKWKSKYSGKFLKEPYSPYIEATQPLVQVVPENFVFGIMGSNETWQSLGNWQNTLMSGLQNLPVKEKFDIDKVLEGKNSKLEKIEALYNYLQENTRYINVTLGIGGLLPYSAEYVAENKYGDCKALTNYMRTMLSYAGIESYYTLINAGDNIEKIETDFPSQQFNHVILMTPLDGDTLWIECTSKNNPLGYLGTFTQNRHSLVVKENSSELIKTPELTVDDVINISRYDIQLSEEGESQISCQIIYRGEYYEFLNGFIKSSDQEDKDRFFRNYLPIPQYTLNSWKVLEKSNRKPEISLQLDINARDQFKKYGNDYMIPMFPTHIPDFTKPGMRKNPVWIHYPIASVDTIVYEVPDFLKIVQHSEEKTITTQYGEYSITYDSSDKQAIVIRKFVLYPGKYSLEKYPEFFKFISEIRTTERNNVILLN